MTDRWTAAAIARLTNYQLCPRCETGTLVAGVCRSCLADLRGGEAIELATATREAVAALEARAAIIDRLPIAPAPQSVSPAAPLPAFPAQPPSTPGATAVRPSSQLSVQSVLAVAGAGLVAVAAIVFTFLSTELDGQLDLRSLVVASTTVVFLLGAWLLSRAGLRFSGETVGALGMVFVALDIWSVSRYAQAPVSEWTAAAIATLVASAVLVAVALLARIRTWLWTGVLGLALVPAFFGYGAAHEWYSVLGHVGSGFAALALVSALPSLSARFASSLTAERVTLVIGRMLLIAIIGVQLVTITPPSPLDASLTAAAVLLALAGIAVLSTRDSLPRVWSLGAGALAAMAASAAPLSLLTRLEDEWIIAIAPLGALTAVVVLAALVQAGATAAIAGERRPLHRELLLVGAWAVALLVAAPAGLVAVSHILRPGTPSGIADTGVLALVGVLVPVAAGLTIAALGPRVTHDERGSVVLRAGAAASAAWFGMYALVTLTSLASLTAEARLALAVGAAIVIALLVWRVVAVAAAPLYLRLPLIVGAHVLLLHAFIQAWPQGVVGTVAQAAIVLGTVALSFTVARVARPLHIGAAMAVALLVFSGALDEYTVLDTAAVVSLTATLAVLAAIAATLARPLRIGYWYAILVVTVVPLALALGWRLADDSGWIALPAAAAAVLGLVLLASRRSGSAVVLRAVGAAMVLPALSAAVVGIVPVLASRSGSPIVLPIVAALVACTLPFTMAVGGWLESRGVSGRDARTTRLAIEGSALLTAAIAVVIALLRPAAGFTTTFLVLAIVGLGGAATAVFSGRRYGWVIAYSAWSGALWSLFALWGVEVLEPYVLPPAIAAVLIGVAAVLRGRPGQWMVISGLVIGALPTLGLLAAEEGDALATGWRLWGLLAASAVLVALGVLVARVTRLVTLRVPVLGVAILTASAGAIGAVNHGIDRAHTTVSEVTFAIMPGIGLAALAAVIAAIAARLIAPTASRWLYVPALAYLLVGCAAGIRPDAVSIWALFALMALYLVGMIATAVRTRSGFSGLPPVWLWFAFAWVAAVVSWSQREVLRVEGYSIPMAVALLAVGVVAWRSGDRAATANSWPVGFSGSWPLLGPGLFVLFVPSILATFTTPETWRAVFVIVLALAAILLGSRLKLAAPFIGGIAVLPLENVVVFAVQSSRNIQSTPWWVTLASAGAVLLVIAVTAERKTSGGGIAARIRDLN